MELNTARRNPLKCLNSLHLKIIAIVLMVLDHAWGTIAVGHNWMTSVGRIAFPIFAFQLVEGFCMTHDRKAYVKRMFLWALISEIPFNLMVSGSPFLYPFHQNVLFTFTEGLLLLGVLEKAKQKTAVRYILTCVLVVIGGFLLGTITFVDYNGYGLLMIFLFYFTRNVKFGWVIQLLGMLYINCEMMGGLVFPVQLFGYAVEIPEQGLACLALPLIWMYNGERGFSNKAVQIGCYAFYPAHILILDILNAAGFTF